MENKWFIILLMGVMMLSLVSADKVTFDEEENWAKYEGTGFWYETPYMTTCSYKYCPIYLNFWTQVGRCVPLDMITMPSIYGNLNPQIIVDDSYTIDTSLSTCTCDEELDFDGNTICNWGENNVHVTHEWIDEMQPEFNYNSNKEYCYDSSPVYSEEYLNYLDGEFCADAGFNTYPAYFIAPKDSQGKYDLCLEFGGTNYCIDPYWTTTASNWENGTFNYTEEAVTGELQINDSIEFPDNQGTDLNRDMSDSRGLWHLNNESGFDTTSYVYDYSGRDNNLTIYNYTSTFYDSSIYKLGSGAVYLNNTLQQWLESADSDTYDFVTDAGSFSMGVWFKDDGSPRYAPLMAWSSTDDANNYHWVIIQLRFVTDNTINAQMRGNSGTNRLCSTSSLPYEDGDWHFYTLVNSGTTINLYMDGIWKCSATATLSGGVRDRFTIGNNYQQKSTFPYGIVGGGYGLNGWVDEPFIMNKSLSADEVMNLYSAQKGYYESEVFDAGASVNWTNITWVSNLTYNATNNFTMNISVQSCDDSLCDGETWNATYTEPDDLTCGDNQYFQYRIDMSRNDVATLLSPEIWNVSIGYEELGGEEPPTGINYTDTLDLPLFCFNYEYNNLNIPNVDNIICKNE